MTGPRIALILDHPQRDLAGIVLVAHELCQRGATCHIVPLNLQEEEVWALAPDFVLLNFVRRGTDDFAARLFRAGIGVGVLDTEGGVWDTPRSYSCMFWSDRSLLHQVRPACMWGPALARHVVEDGLFCAPQVAVTGCPRFDFYHPHWQPVMADGCRDGSGHILVNTNYSFANPRFSTVERNIAQLRDEIGQSHERALQQAETEEHAIHEVIAMTRSLAGDFPGLRIVLRPHPFENPETYRIPLAEFPNVTINTAGPVQPQIFDAAVVIQRGCSTAIESGMAGVPTLSPGWFTVAGFAPMTESVSDPCATYAELRDKVAAVLDGDYRIPDRQRAAIRGVVADWFHASDGLAFRRVADALMPALPGARVVDEARCRRYRYGIRDAAPAMTRARLSRELRRLLRLSPDWSFRRMRSVPRTFFEQTDKHFSAAEVSELVRRIHRAPGTAGSAPKPVAVALARTRGDLRDGYHGYSVTLSCA